MKLLNRLLLINWHYFTHECISFGQLNFLTGKNASGKSTIIDAMQVVLYGDTSGSFFNKAANGKGNRTLLGYLCGELGDAEDLGFRYLRNCRFTSYIALEFYDDIKKKYFTAGCCFDIYSENDMQKLFFSYDGQFHDNEFISNDGVPISIQDLRIYLKSQYSGHYYTTDVGRDFRTNLYGKLGGLRDQFCQLMKKAVSFNPNVDIQQFISEFVCNSQQTVDISQMQENIRSYKQLEKDADILKEKMELLDNISNSFQSFTKSEQDFLMYSYLLDRADAEIVSDKLTKEKRNADELEKSINKLKSIISEEEKHIAAMQKERDDLNIQLGNNEQAQAIKLLEDKIEEKEKELDRLNKEYSMAVVTLTKNISDWRTSINQMINKFSTVSIDLNNPALQSRIDDIKEEAEQLLQKIELMQNLDASNIEKIGKYGFGECRERVTALNKHSIQISTRTDEEMKRVLDERSDLQEEERTLENGIYHFPKDVVDLKEAVISKLRLTSKTDVPVVIVAEAAEIRGERWRNVIEGYLHAQKYYLIVPPEYFQTAVKVYDKIKRQKSIYGTGIVDIEKMAGKKTYAQAGSLAEEIQTDDTNVRLFLDYTLGRVIKCDKATDLRNHHIAVTDDGMLYQNYVVRAMNPERWAKPAIGQNAIKSRLIAVKNEIKYSTSVITSCAIVKQALDKISNLSVFSKSEVEHAVSVAHEVKKIPLIKADIEQLKVSRAAIDESAVKAIKDHIVLLENNINSCKNKKEDYIAKKSTCIEQNRVCKDVNIPNYEHELAEKELRLSERYEQTWVEKFGSIRYERELLSRGSALNIAVAFPRERSRVENKKNEMWHEVQDLRKEYNNTYKMGYDIHIKDNELYDDIWLELSENKLPEYMTRIQDTKNKAFEQFREDFLSRLEHNIDDARRQIEGLNQALKGSSFGEDTYRFLIVPKPEYKRYYDMIVDPMKLDGGYNLYSEQFNIKYKDEISDLFALITNEDSISKSGNSEDYEKRVRKFTDYRTYLSFDLEVTDKDGDTQRLSKTMGKKSGGETQTPFYIAVLASFAQLYRVGRDRVGNTTRLIIFDEAFSKMDGERISRSVELLRQFKFQAILSAPPDKIADIVPYMDSNICVLRNGKNACVRNFDSNKLRDLEYD
ncbi:MAG: SbcC/MukB-like Walker B domain-containing protein [Clostridia bacterium]|nr:SbcC/MukB-like Walker B domain-containing protein [Clostridia bacterium]